MSLLSDIRRDEAYLVQTRRHLHQNPELSLREHDTAAFIEGELAAAGIPFHRVGETGVLGTIAGTPGGGTVLLRADIDALPIRECGGAPYASRREGAMHACGHDGHTAALLGAARLLHRLRGDFAGEILLVFQQAEEFGRGSRFFIGEGIGARADRAFAVHVSPELPVGAVGVVHGADSASCDHFRIAVTGKSAHITKPQEGTDALHIACLIAEQLPGLPGRLLNPFETALLGIGKLTAGTAYNVVAGEAVLEGSIRTFSAASQQLLQREVAALAGNIAAAHGGGAQTRFETFAPALVNTDAAVDEALAVARGLLGEDRVVTDPGRIRRLAADDFSAFIDAASGVYVHVGTAGENPNTHLPLHHDHFDIDEGGLAVAAALYAGYALHVLRGNAL